MNHNLQDLANDDIVYPQQLDEISKLSPHIRTLCTTNHKKGSPLAMRSASSPDNKVEVKKLWKSLDADYSVDFISLDGI